MGSAYVNFCIIPQTVNFCCAGSQCFLKCVRIAVRCCLRLWQLCLPSWSCVRAMMHPRIAKPFVLHNQQKYQQIEFLLNSLLVGFAVGCCVSLLARLPPVPRFLSPVIRFTGKRISKFLPSCVPWFLCVFILFDLNHDLSSHSAFQRSDQKQSEFHG